MKYLKTFEERQTYYGAMKNMYDIEPEFTPPYESGTVDEVIDRYCKQYPENVDFFNAFIEEYPNRKEYDAAVLAVCEDEYENDTDSYNNDYDDEDDEDDNVLTDDEIVDRYWSPEGEIYMLEQDLNVAFPGGDIWSNFINDMRSSDWSDDNLEAKNEIFWFKNKKRKKEEEDDETDNDDNDGSDGSDGDYFDNFLPYMLD